MTTDQFKAMKAAEAAFNASGELADLRALEAAEAAFFAALKTASAKWAGLTLSDQVRASAELNAFETEGTAEDELRWLEIAISTAQEIIDCGCAV